MELNTSYWGTGDEVRISGDFRAVVSSDLEGSAKTIRELVQSTQIPFNEYIDESVFWCVSRMSEMSRYRFIWITYDRNNRTWIVARQTGSLNPYKNSVHPLLLRDTSGGGEASKYEYGGYNSSKLAFGITNNNAGVTEQVILRCARGKIISLAEVIYYDNCAYDAASSTYTHGSRHSIPLYNFINNSSLYGNSSVHVIGMVFYPYAGTSYTSRSDSGVEFTYLYPTHSPFDAEALNFSQSEIEDFDMSSSLYGDVTIDFSADYFSYVNSENYVIGSRYLLNVHDNRYDSGSDIIYCIRGCSTEYWTFTKYSGGSYDEFGMRLTDHTKLMDIFHEFANTGLFYTDKQDVATSGDLENLTDEHIFWGTIRHGYATGEVNHGGPNGKEVIKTTNPDLEESGRDPTANPDYDGEENTDTNKYDDNTPIQTPTLSTVGVFNRSYAMTATNIKLLADWLWNADGSKFDEIVAGLGLMGENPINGIIDIRLYPFDITQMISTGGSQAIKIGRTVSEVYGRLLGNDNNAVISLGSCSFFRSFKNFLDYTPYTEARLYLPYCGCVPVDTSEFMGHEISANMIVDVVTGACTCFVYRDGIIMFSANGSCGVSIPVSATDSAAYASSVLNATVGSLTQAVSSAASGNIGGVIEGAVKGAYEVATAPTQYAQSGSASPSCSLYLPQYPYFIIDRPVTNAPDNYGHCVGYACDKYGVLSDFSGFTVCANVDLSGITATSDELDEIKRLLEEGVYL